MTELVSDEQAVISSKTTTIKEKTVPKKIVVYKPNFGFEEITMDHNLVMIRKSPEKNLMTATES